MNIASLYFDPGTGSIEILIFQLSFKASVYGISKGGTEMFYIKKVYPFSDFFVGVKPIRILPCFTSGCFIRYSAAVMISATPALSSAPNSVVPSVVIKVCPLEESQLRKICQRHRQLLVQTDISPIVIFNDTGMDIGPTHIGTRIDMRDKTDHRAGLHTRELPE